MQEEHACMACHSPANGEVFPGYHTTGLFGGDPVVRAAPKEMSSAHWLLLGKDQPQKEGGEDVLTVPQVTAPEKTGKSGFECSA